MQPRSSSNRHVLEKKSAMPPDSEPQSGLG